MKLTVIHTTKSGTIYNIIGTLDDMNIQAINSLKEYQDFEYNFVMFKDYQHKFVFNTKCEHNIIKTKLITYKNNKIQNLNNPSKELSGILANNIDIVLNNYLEKLDETLIAKLENKLPY